MPHIIIIPGLANQIWRWPFNLLVRFYCWYFDLTGAGNDWSQFKTYLSDLHKEVVLAEPLRWFSKKEIARVGKIVARVIDAHESPAILIGYSLGAAVAESAITQCAHPERVTRLISIAGPHKAKYLSIPPNVEVVNIYSDADTYLDFSNRMLYFRGYKDLEHAQNIKLDGLRHSDFSNPSQFEYYSSLLR